MSDCLVLCSGRGAGGDFGRSTSFSTFAPPGPYQPAGLRRHLSMGSNIAGEHSDELLQLVIVHVFTQASAIGTVTLASCVCHVIEAACSWWPTSTLFMTNVFRDVLQDVLQ